MFEVQSIARDTGSQSFPYLFIALSITRCSKSAQKFAVRVRQGATVVEHCQNAVVQQYTIEIQTKPVKTV